MDVTPAGYPLLETIASPADLRKLPASKLIELAQQLRQFLIHSVATRGGHFAAMEQPEALAAEVRAFFRPLR